MTRFAIGLALLSSASMASAETDFGIRTVSGERSVVRIGEHQKVGQRDSSAVQAHVAQEAPAGASWARLKSGSGNLSAAAGMGSRWGRITSTYRSPKHNRRVGGVPNSYHLSGRAIDIARRRGVTHSQIAQAYRLAGMQLIESLDEGDHSHFAFGTGRLATPAVRCSWWPAPAPARPGC